MGKDSERTLHLLQRLDDFFGQLDLLTAIEVVLELEVDIEGGACD